MISILPSEEPSNSATASRARAASRWIARSRIVRPVPGGPQPAAIFAHLRAVRPMLGLERQTPQRIDERAAPPAGDDAHRHGDERRAIGRRSGLVDGAAGQRRHRGEAVDIGGLALIGRHAERGVALEVLDRDVALARGERDVLQRHVVLEIDPAPALRRRPWARRLRCDTGRPARSARRPRRRPPRWPSRNASSRVKAPLAAPATVEVRDRRPWARARPAPRHSADVRAPGRRDAPSATSRPTGAARRNRASARRRAPLRRRGVPMTPSIAAPRVTRQRASRARRRACRQSRPRAPASAKASATG